MIGSNSILADATGAAAGTVLVQSPSGILAMLFLVLAVIFWGTRHPVIGRMFKIIPSLVFCYFVPTALTTFGVIPAESELYSWVRQHVLPASLILLILALDIPGIIRLGPKAIIMLLTGTASVVIGGPIAFFICKGWLPDDAWQGLAALSGSWIGGGANFVAIGDQAGASDQMLALMVIPDVFCANIWMGVLLFFAGRHREMDARSGADTSAIRDLEQRMSEFQERTNRIPQLADLMIIIAIGFVGSWLSMEIGIWLDATIASLAEPSGSGFFAGFRKIVSASTWKYVLATTGGVLLSLTRARNLEGAGASKIGSVMIYLLVACIGASANFRLILEAPAFVVVGFVWIIFHAATMLLVAKLIRAPVFLLAVASQANIGGAASAPVVASAFHPSLAPVGVMLAIAGYVLGTYAGLICMHMLRMVAES